MSHQSYRAFFLRILFPTVAAIGLFVLTLFLVIVPAFEANSLTRKREMIRELTASAWSVLAELQADQSQGLLSEEEAQARAVSRIRDLRYGEERKDYFWITDMTPRMVMHPYRPELDGEDLTDFEDRAGNKLFVAFVDAVRRDGEGYVEYQWQWKDDATRIVPKLSYVRGFEPWGWIVGTGIYIEDVRAEIALMTRRLIRISLAITGVIALLLLFITHQSLRIERQRRQAEQELRGSKDKYQALVEATTEGIIMLVDGRHAYFNRTLRDMLGYTEAEFGGLSIAELVYTDPDQAEGESAELRALLEGKPSIGQFEAKLRRKNGEPVDVVLVTSTISFAGQQGFVIAARDITRHKEVEGRLGDSEAQYRALTDTISIGVFRTTLGRKGRFVEANPATMRILGIQDRDELLAANIFDLFHDADDRESFLRELLAEGSIKNRILRLRKKDGTVPVLSVSAVLVHAEAGAEELCDGVLEDITERTRLEEVREGLIVELQTAMLFLNQPVRQFVRDALVCDMNISIAKLAEQMVKSNANAALLRTGEGVSVGIVTDSDLRKRAVAVGRDGGEPALSIMSAPLIAMPDRALLFEAALLMQETGASHIVVRGSSGAILGMLSSRDVLQVHRYSSAFLLREIHRAESQDELVQAHERLPGLVRALINSGANPRNTVRIVASVSDAITTRMISIAVDELGPPPARFAFLAMGSEGREEQTLKTDQDNAIVYEDVGPDRIEAVGDYFRRLGERVCEGLASAGYAFCFGEVMARNPKWCQPLSQWRAYFADWITTADPLDLRAISIFFDFRCVYGEKELAAELRRHVNETAGGKAAFFQHLAVNALHYKPPIGFFGRIVVGSGESQPETFDIKKAMMPIVDFARIYTLRQGVMQTNTLDRLQQIRDQEVVTKTEFEDLVRAYDYLMALRLKHQTHLLSNNLAPDNYINPKELPQIELVTLKRILTQIAEFQNKLKVEFTGTA